MVPDTRARHSFLRGAIWYETGDPETAVLFFEHAASLEPSNGKFLMDFLTALDAADPTEATRRAEAIVREPERYPPAATVRSAQILFSAASFPLRPEMARRFIPILEASLVQIERGDEADSTGYRTSVLFPCLEFIRNPRVTRKWLAGRVAPGIDGSSTSGFATWP